MTAPRSLGPAVTPQAVLSPLTDAAIFLVATVREDGESTVRDLLEDLGALQRAVGFRLPAAQLSCVTGIGSNLWDRLFTGKRPAGLHRFRAWKGPRHSAPATPGDLLFHLRPTGRAGQGELPRTITDFLVAAIDGENGAVHPGHLVHIPAGTRHNLVNDGPDDLKLYTVYAPPQHAEGTIHRTKAEADAS